MLDVDGVSGDLPQDEIPESKTLDRDHAIQTGLLTAGYIAGGYIVGLLWTTPLFVFVYCVVAGKSKSIALVLALVGFSIAFGFMTVLNIPLAEGEIIGEFV
jgi:hypothetical protein